MNDDEEIDFSLDLSFLFVCHYKHYLNLKKYMFVDHMFYLFIFFNNNYQIMWRQ